MLNPLKYKLLILICIFYLGACATIPLAPVRGPGTAGMEGLYHRMIKGQTLWRISKIYNVGLDELVRINNIADVRNIKTGQLIFVPKTKDTISHPQNITLESFEEFIWPVKGKIVSYFGEIHKNMLNKGLNIRVSSGAEIIAARSGLVSFYSPNFGSFGKTIIIDHQDGYFSVYSQVTETFVNTGEVVTRGKKIARLIYKRKNLSNYLHFEIRKRHVPQNPLFYLP